MRNWSQEEEAQRLAERFSGISQASFAREHGVPGGASMLSQHIKGRRPINLPAALAYARGFGVPLEEISPRLAAQAHDL
jgi:transcriptional regulator with XRE-family HTH domain